MSTNGTPVTTIKHIDEGSIKFIAAGEKISDIETAIRELVENSIDAGAKVIEVRLTRFGIDCIEVEDNGSGIEQENLKTIGLRYHTSKISDHTKLQEDLETFGFRGEALSCLCSISQVSILTKTKSSATGSRLTFNNDGTLMKLENVARSTGTTVTVKNLFHSLPVRRRELETTAKRQYDKIVKLLYEQILARPFIKFSLCKKSSSKKEKDFTHGGTTLEGAIITIFGIKILESLMHISNSNPSDGKEDIKVKEELNRRQTRSALKIPEDGSQCSSFETESQTSQEIPVETKIEPIRDESFFKRNRKSTHARRMPEYSIYGYISKIGCGRNSTDCQFIFVNKKPCDVPKVARIINEIYRSYSNNQSPFFCLFIGVQNWAADFNVPRKRAVLLQDELRLCDLVKDSLERLFSPNAPGMQISCAVANIPVKTMKPETNGTLPPKQGEKREHESDPADDGADGQPTKKSPEIVENIARAAVFSHVQIEDSDLGNVNNSENEHIQVRPDRLEETNGLKETECTLPPKQGEKREHEADLIDDIVDDQPKKKSLETVEDTAGEEVIAHEQFDECKFEQVNITGGEHIRVRLDGIEDLGLALRRERAQRQTPKDSKEFSFAIHPQFNTVAEQELKFNLNKTSFEDMQVIGHFNRGFIITRLNKHLFIIDQHATDERANFEDQLEKSPLVKQPMVCPKPLYLNSIQENTIINNIDAFQKRGLEFVVDQSKIAGMRVMLKSTSICKGQGIDECLTKEDIEELIDVINESPNNLPGYILKKVKGIAATRACRKSVMIGDSLQWSQMEDIVSRMANLKNPWVCAHNRPTIRHLMDTDWTNR